MASAAKGKAVVRPHSPSASKVKATPPNKSSSTASAAKGKAAITHDSSSVHPTPEPGSVQASIYEPNRPFANYATASSAITGTLLDTSVDQASNRAEAPPSRSYAEDLMDLDFYHSDNLASPIQFKMKVKEEKIQTGQSSVGPDLREIDSQLASSLPLLRRVLAPDDVEKFLWVKSQVEQKINKGDHNQTETVSQLTDKTLEKSADLKQSAASDPTYQVPGISKGKHAPTLSLSNTIEGRTQEWSNNVITTTRATKGSILGEHVTRSRAAERHNSTASTTSTSGLVEGIQKLRIHDEKPSTMPQAIESTPVSGGDLAPLVQSANIPSTAICQSQSLWAQARS